MTTRFGGLTFEGPFDFVSRSWRGIIRREPIVYRLRVWEAEASTFRSIPRAGSVDPDGVLDLPPSS